MKFHWKTIGHEPVKQYFERLIPTGVAPSHAFLFAGPSGIGKQTLMEDLAAIWLCGDSRKRPCGQCAQCLARLKQTHPDLSRVSLPEGAKFVPLESIQSALDSLRTTSFFNQYRIILIPRIELFSPGAANALLKSLEEPPPKTFFFASTDHISRALPTIVSRCILIRLSPLAPETIAHFLATHAPKGVNHHPWISYAQGKIGALMPMMKNPAAWTDMVSMHERRARALTGSLAEKMVLFKEKDPEALSALTELLHDFLLQSLSLPEKMKFKFLEPIFPQSPRESPRFVRTLREALESLRRKENGNLSLELTNLFTHL